MRLTHFMKVTGVPPILAPWLRADLQNSSKKQKSAYGKVQLIKIVFDPNALTYFFFFLLSSNLIPVFKNICFCTDASGVGY